MAGPETTGTIDDVATGVTLEDGRITIAAEGDVTLYVRGREHDPLSTDEEHVELSIAGDGIDADLSLDGRQADALRDALNHALEYDGGESDDGGPGVDATESFVWNCRDCGFIGEWLTVDGTCPECGGRDLPTEVR